DGEGFSQADAPFFQGYQLRAIDWVAVTYYRCERVVQDVIECAHTVCLRDDLGAAVKGDATTLFDDLFAPDGNMDAARRASMRLPRSLTYLTKRLSA
ncbi:MAG TPA: hypothetical protein VF739_11810, partial [Ktedonobacterales bacterium]